MNIFRHIQECLSVLFGAGLFLFWFLWNRRGVTIQKQKVQIQKSTDDAEVAPLEARTEILEKEMEIADADRLKKEALLTARLNGTDSPSGNTNGSKPLP